MLFNLVRKDILIIKKYVFIMLLVVIVVPPFFTWWSPEVSPLASFIVSAVFAEFMLCQYVSMKETVYPKAAALLCAAPYPRSILVKAKYAFFILIFACCYVIYCIETVFIPRLDKLSLLSVLGTFAFLSLLYGIYIPIQYKLGYEKTKFFFMIIIMGTPFLLPIVLKKNSTADISFLLNIHGNIQYVILAASAVLVLYISTMVSTYIYARKELL